MTDIEVIVARAAERKGGLESLHSLLPARPDVGALRDREDGYFIGEMTRSIFQAGFVWRVIESKWDGFLEAFHHFDPAPLMRLRDEDWEDYLSDTRIVRNRQKILAVRHNLWFVSEVSNQHGGFGRFLADWPAQNLIGLLQQMKKQGSRLGGNTGQYFLQKVGMDSFALTRDVVLALQNAGLEISDNPASQRDFRVIQKAFNEWSAQTGYSLLQLSYILAFSAGENRIMRGS